jgi:MraZ protein
MKLLPLGQRDAREFKRILFSRATYFSMYNQGRVVIMKYLRDYARINKEIMVIGVLDRIEIWSKDVWQKYFEEVESSYEDIAERIYEQER